MTLSRPYVTMNMAMSTDGKISTYQGKSIQFSSVEDRRVMDEIRFQADAILIGANTLRVDGIHLWIKTEALVKKRAAQKKAPHPINIVISRSLDIPTDCRFFSYPDTEKWIITSENSDSEKMNDLARFARIHALSQSQSHDDIDLSLVMAYLKKWGVNRLLLEGGSRLNFQMISHNFVDELYLTICPIIIGGERVASPVGGQGFPSHKIRNLKFLSCRHFEGELFLRYQFLHGQ